MPDRRWGALLSLLAGCAVAYRPCPVDVASLPVDAFGRCRDVLVARYGAVQVAEAEPLRLQTAWAEDAEVGCERRASVFADGGGLAVVVEVRWLREPLLGVPDWSEVRGDAVAERELATALREALVAP